MNGFAIIFGSKKNYFIGLAGALIGLEARQACWGITGETPFMFLISV